LRNSKTAEGWINLGSLGINSAKLHRLSVRQSVHSTLSNIKSGLSMIDSKDVDGMAVVSQSIALAAL